MASFQDKWAAPQKQSFMDKLGDTLKPKGSLKPEAELDPAAKKVTEDKHSLQHEKNDSNFKIFNDLKNSK